MATHGTNPFFTSIMTGCLLSACAQYNHTARQSMESYCTIENGYQQGAEGAAYTDVCPDVLALAFLDGYQTGYAIHLAQLEINAMERAIQTLSGDLKQIWSALDAASLKLERSDTTPAERLRWRDEIRQLSARQSGLTAEIDEIESEVAARKTQLLQQSHAIAAND